MSKNNLIVASTDIELFTTKRLLQEAKKLKYSTSHINPYRFHIPQKTLSLSGLYFHRTSGTSYDDFDLTVAKYHQIAGMKTSAPLERLPIFRSKDHQSLFFREHSLPAIKTLMYRGATSEAFETELEALSKNEKYILKMSRGNQGIGVNLLESKKSLMSVLETFHALKDQKFIIQPYIHHKKEWRLFIIKHTIVACIEKKISANDFRGNSKRSIARALKKVPSNLAHLALEAFSKSALFYAGIDILECPNEGLKILEVNCVPGFEQAEALSDHNIARELLLKLYAQ